MYSVTDIVDKVLWAKTQVPIYALPWDSAQIIGYFQPGQRVGTVHTFFEIKAGRSILYWGFKDVNGQPYYTPHRANYYDLDRLRAQGVLTDAEKEAQAQSLPERITKTVVRGFITYGLIRAASRIFFR